MNRATTRPYSPSRTAHPGCGANRTWTCWRCGARIPPRCAWTGSSSTPSWQLHPQARVFLPAIRPAFVGLQCGLGLGLARASIDAARRALEGRPSILDGELAALEAEIEAAWQALSSGLDAGRLRERPRELLALRLRMVGIAAEAVALELQALGGRALLRGQDGGYARRAREAAFLAVVTPTVAQLKGDLAKQAAQAAPPANR